MKFLVTRKKVVHESVVLDVPVPAFMNTTEAAEYAAKFFARQWNGTWKSDTVEEITVTARAVSSDEKAANDEPVLTLTDAVDEAPVHRVLQTSRWESMRETGALAGFVLQRSGWLERKFLA